MNEDFTELGVDARVIIYVVHYKRSRSTIAAELYELCHRIILQSGYDKLIGKNPEPDQRPLLL